MTPEPAHAFHTAFSHELVAAREQYDTPRSFDLMFVAFLRASARFGYFTVGPISLDVRLVEEAFERRLASAESPATDEFVRLSELVIEESARAGRKRVDELDYLFAFMRCGAGLPAHVFGELGVTPADVLRFLRNPPARVDQRSLDRIMTPEEVAEYLKVHVHTVRGWIRDGRLPARRILGLRSLRIRAADVERLLRPLAEDGDISLERAGTSEER